MHRILIDFADAALYLLLRLIQISAVVIGVGVFFAQLFGRI